jgi:hypothetical protein
MNTIEEVIEYYKSVGQDKHKFIYHTFNDKATIYDNSVLLNHYNMTEGFGETAFSWNWYLLIKSLPDTFKFLEIGVYKARVLSLVQLVSSIINKQATIYGVTPLGDVGDKYSKYEPTDYMKCIMKSYSDSGIDFDNTNIIKGYSQDPNIIESVSKEGPFDIVFIDGCHDYEIVCLDIKNYTNMVKPGGYLVIDDASSMLQGAYGQFLGHYDVAKAINDTLVGDSRFEHIYAVGHNRVWKRAN